MKLTARLLYIILSFDTIGNNSIPWTIIKKLYYVSPGPMAKNILIWLYAIARSLDGCVHFFVMPPRERSAILMACGSEELTQQIYLTAEK